MLLNIWNCHLRHLYGHACNLTAWTLEARKPQGLGQAELQT